MNFGGVRVVQEPLAFLFLGRFTRRKVFQRENDLGGFQLAPGFANQLERSAFASRQIDDFIAGDIKRTGQRAGLAQQILDVVAEDQTRNKSIGTQFVDSGRAQIRRMRLQPPVEGTEIAGKCATLTGRDVRRRLLEEELRVPVFGRSSSGVDLTDAGTIFLKYVQETEKSRAAVMEKLQAPIGLLTGILRLGSSMTIASYYLPDVLVGFKAKHAAVKCEVVEGNTDLILGLLLDQRIELGLVERPCRRRAIQVRPCYQDEIIWVAAPFDRLAKVKNPSTKALLERPIISRELGSRTRRVMELALRQQGCSLSRLHIEQELPSTEAINRMVAAGAGIGYVSRLR